ncbi:unnamed protein product, partial [Amoebophrya sp. A25]
QGSHDLAVDGLTGNEEALFSRTGRSDENARRYLEENVVLENAQTKDRGDQAGTKDSARSEEENNARNSARGEDAGTSWSSETRDAILRRMLGVRLNEDVLNWAAIPDTVYTRHISWVEAFCGCPQAELLGDVQQCNECRRSDAQLYAASLYYALMTITSIGYGDTATPATVDERWLGCVFQIIAAMLWVQVIGSACGVLANMDSNVKEFYQTIDELNHLTGQMNLSQRMRRRLRIFFYNTRQVNRMRSYHELMSRLSPNLQAELFFSLNGTFAMQVPYLRDVEHKLLAYICQKLKEKVFAQGELFVDIQSLYILKRGLVLMDGKVYISGQYWGEDFLLDAPELMRFYRGAALTYAETAHLTRQDLNDCLLRYPSERARIRRFKVRLAAMRGFVNEARRRLAAQARPEGEKMHASARAEEAERAEALEAQINSALAELTPRGIPALATRTSAPGALLSPTSSGAAIGATSLGAPSPSAMSAVSGTLSFLSETADSLPELGASYVEGTPSGYAPSGFSGYSPSACSGDTTSAVNTPAEHLRAGVAASVYGDGGRETTGNNIMGGGPPGQLGMIAEEGKRREDEAGTPVELRPSSSGASSGSDLLVNRRETWAQLRLAEQRSPKEAAADRAGRLDRREQVVGTTGA